VTVALHTTKASLLGQMQYRTDFLVQIGMAFFWATWAVMPVLLVYSIRENIAGFDRDQALLVLAAYICAKALLDGLISPNMLAVVEHVRRGTLDFVLLKPVDSQLMISTGRVVVAKLIDLVSGIVIGAIALSRVHPAPSPAALLLALTMLLTGLVIIYSIWLMVVSIAFWLVKVDNLSYLFGSIFDAGRWPITVFRGWVRTMLTFVVPVAVVTSYPALAVLGRLPLESALVAVGLAVAFLLAGRRVWTWAVAHYASASS